jgi:NAD(P)-dependent dehydrogenase (short-subunit alcohol dehydrogenase family)
LKGRVALVTGAAGPIGRAIAETFAELGAAVALLDRPGSGAETVARRITDRYGVLTTALHVDLTDEMQVRKVPQRVVDSCGRLDIVVANAVFDASETSPLPMEQQSIDSWRKALEDHLIAPFLLVQQAIPALKASGKGSIITIGAADLATPVAGAASKGGLLQMTRWLATTLAPEVRVNAIVPAVLERNTPDAFKGAYVARTPLGRMAREDDVKGVAAFLASDLSAYITGQTIALDGGRTDG